MPVRFRIKIVIPHDNQIKLGPFGQIRWLIDDDPPASDMRFDSQHAAKDIATRASMPVVGAATQTRPGVAAGLRICWAGSPR